MCPLNTLVCYERLISGEELLIDSSILLPFIVSVSSNIRIYEY